MEILTLGSQRLVHIDLKGAPPKLKYFEEFFPFIKQVGATGILLEWEDTFPYTRELTPVGGLSDIAQTLGAPYSVEDAKQLLELAMDNGLTVIPLVQTFGHMEFVLKHDQWSHLREVPEYPSSMCPSNSEVMPLVRSLIKQIVELHVGIEYLHIGADEIWHMGLCAACQKRVETSKYGKASLYLDHITQVVYFIKDTYPYLKIIIWDDMVRNMDLQMLKDYHIGNLIEPMIWHYNSQETFQIGLHIWEKYSNVFPNVWVASAFKGATSSCQILPVTKYHISNHMGWLSELGTYAGKIVNFRGIAFTGWSRYDHYATLCELLPCGIPSLSLCMKTWLNGGYSPDISGSVGKILGYNEHFPFVDVSLENSKLSQQELTFPGWQLYIAFERFVSVRAKYKNVVDSDQMQTWCNQWQITNNYTNPMHINAILPAVKEVLLELQSGHDQLKSILAQVYYNHTVDELLGTRIAPLIQNLQQIKDNCERQLSIGCRVRVVQKSRLL